MRLVTNHWGWTPHGFITWVKYGWGFFSVWGAEVRGSLPIKFKRYLKIGPVVFNAGQYEDKS